jgi:hypothetical protein
MLLPFRWLFYGTAAAPAQTRAEATHKHPKIQRKLRRLAQWSDAIAPARVDVIAPVTGIVLDPPRLAPARASVGAAIPPVRVGLRVTAPVVSIAAAAAPIFAKIRISDATVEAGIDLFDYEIAALMAA